MTPTETLKAFKKTKWYEPTVARYKAHLKACEELECEELIEPFLRFAREVTEAPSDAVRASMLAVEPLEPYEPFMRYPAYVEPARDEQRLDLYSAEMGRKLR